MLKLEDFRIIGASTIVQEKLYKTDGMEQSLVNYPSTKGSGFPRLEISMNYH